MHVFPIYYEFGFSNHLEADIMGSNAGPDNQNGHSLFLSFLFLWTNWPHLGGLYNIIILWPNENHGFNAQNASLS